MDEVTREDNECAVCLDVLKDEIFKLSRCSHPFHPTCAKKSLVRKRNCPLCRRTVTQEEEIHLDISSTCSICLNELEPPVVQLSGCHHAFHRNCAKENCSETTPACPACDRPLADDEKKKILSHFPRPGLNISLDSILLSLLFDIDRIDSVPVSIMYHDPENGDLTCKIPFKILFELIKPNEAREISEELTLLMNIVARFRSITLNLQRLRQLFGTLPPNLLEARNEEGLRFDDEDVAENALRTLLDTLEIGPGQSRGRWYSEDEHENVDVRQSASTNETPQLVDEQDTRKEEECNDGNDVSN